MRAIPAEVFVVYSYYIRGVGAACFYDHRA